MQLKFQGKLLPQGFDFKEYPIPLRSFLLILLAIFVVESLIMEFLHAVTLPIYVDVLLDAGLLVIVIIPVLYFTFLRPMMLQYYSAVNSRRATETLWRASMDLARTIELEKVYSIMLDQVARLAPYDLAELCLLTSPTRLEVEAVRSHLRGTNVPQVGKSWFNPQEFPLLLRVVNEDKSLVIADIGAETAGAADPRLANIRSWLGIPLVVGGKVVGLCELGKLEPNFYTPDHVRMAEALVEQAAVAIQNAWLFEQVLSGRERLVDLTHQLVDVQENERRYIARELHDEVGQAVVSMMVHLNLLEQKAGQPDEVRRISEDMQASLSNVSGMLHELAANLRPASLDHLGLEATLRQFLDQVNENHGLKVNFEYDLDRGNLAPDVKISLYRIVQESVNNILKHAQATRVDVMLKPRGDKLILMIEDDGTGFDPEEARQTHRLGLFGMRERAEALGGELVIESAPGKGTTILVEVPYDPSNYDRG